MTRKLFWQDPYRRALDTVVATVEGDAITVAETIFYAFSGGQESDAGTIAGHPVLEARKAGADIVYTLGPGHGLRPGDAVHMEIDWERRHRLMRLHFAAELVLELVTQRHPAFEKIGAHISADKARIDFAAPASIAPLLPALTDAAQQLIDRDLPIESTFSDEAAGRRYWAVEGFARVPCGGTHLKRTGEVGRITLKRKNVGQGKERVEVRAAMPGENA